MIVSEIEVDTPEEWLETLIALDRQIKLMKTKVEHKWSTESGMTRDGWYIKVLVSKKGNK